MKLPHRRQFLHLAASAAALPALSRLAWAQGYPARPVRLIVPIAPGGAQDILARVMGQWLSERLDQPFVIDNRPGGFSKKNAPAIPDHEVRIAGFRNGQGRPCLWLARFRQRDRRGKARSVLSHQPPTYRLAISLRERQFGEVSYFEVFSRSD
jgi:hypothetical protein